MSLTDRDFKEDENPPDPLDELDEVEVHAPTDYVEERRLARIERNRRDREELQDLWREETLRRKRERRAGWWYLASRQNWERNK